MWFELISEVGVEWVSAVFILCAVILILAGLCWYLFGRFSRRFCRLVSGLREDIETLSGARIENFKQTQVIIGDRGGPLLKKALSEMAEDSKVHFSGFWVPDPAERLNWQMLLTDKDRLLLSYANVTLPVLVSIVISFVLLLVALAIFSGSLDNYWLRSLIMLPLVIGLVSFAVLQQIRRLGLERIEQAWHLFTQRLQRKIPVYNQAAETAALLRQYAQYDEKMTGAVLKLTNRVDALASGELTDSVTAAVGKVMNETVAPVITANSEQISLLTVELADKMRINEERMLRLLADVDSAHRERLNEISQESRELNRQVGENLTGLMTRIGEDQNRLQNVLITEQQETLTGLREAAADSFSSLQATLLARLEEQFDGQETALTSVSVKLAELVDLTQQRQAETLDQMSGDLGRFLDLLEKAQREAIASISLQQQEGVKQLLDRFSGSVEEVLSDRLDPVSKRLTAAAGSLVTAQGYAQHIEETFALQKEQANTLQDNIHSVLAQFVATRQEMADDLSTLAVSAGSMSESAASMSAVYTGSQTGLSDAIDRMSGDMVSLSDVLKEVLSGSAEHIQQLQEQAGEAYEVNRRHLDTVREQIDILSGDLSTRIDQLMIGFSQLTEDLVKNVQTTIENQNSELGGGLRMLTNVMAEEARSISLYAQQIDMNVNQLNDSLSTSIETFSEGMSLELNNTLTRFDAETADIFRRLSVVAAELGDAVEALPQALLSHSQDKKK